MGLGERAEAFDACVWDLAKSRFLTAATRGSE